MAKLTLKDIAEELGAGIRGDGALMISGAAGLGDATEGDLSYIAEQKFLPEAQGSSASAFLVKEFHDGLDRPQLQVDDPQLAFARLLDRLRPRPAYPTGISDKAYIDPEVSLGEGVSVMPGAYISRGASIGKGSMICAGAFVGQGTKVGEGCKLGPNVSIMDGVSVGNRVTIHAGTTIGSDGYGYLQRDGKHVKIPQVGTVVIGDDVEIGANCAIDRATTGATIIGKGSKLDNLVHIAHNVMIGKGALLTGQVGIAGSTKIGDHVVLAGQSGVKDHVELADGVVLAAKSAALTDLKEPGMYAGIPAIPIRDWLKASKSLEKLSDLIKTVRAIQKGLEDNK